MYFSLAFHQRNTCTLLLFCFFFTAMKLGIKLIQCNGNTSHVRLKENNGVTVKTAWLAGPTFENEVKKRVLPDSLQLGKQIIPSICLMAK